MKNPFLPTGITLTAWFASIANSHTPATVGTKLVDEVAIGDGKTLVYRTATGKLGYEAGGGGGGAHGSTHTDGTDNVAVGSGIQISGNTIVPVYGTGASQVCQGNDSRLHSNKLQGAYPVYSHTINPNYQLTAKGYQLNYRTGYNDETVPFGIPFDLLNTMFPGGYTLWIVMSGSTNSITGGNTISIRLLDNSGDTIGASVAPSSIIGERTAPLLTGSAVIGFPLQTAGAPFEAIGPFNTAVPANGTKSITYQMKCTEAAKTFYTSSWVLYAVAT